MLKFCPNYRKVAFSIDGPKEAAMTRLRCKQWSCEFCRQENAKIWYMFLKDKLPKVSDTWYLVTLTAHESERTTHESLANIRTHIDALIKRAKRVFGDLEYVRVYERHPSSQAIHSHFIMAGLSPYVAIGCSVKLQPMAIGVLSRHRREGVWSVKSWFKITARSLKMGYMADVQIIVGSIEDVIRYVVKYLFKDQGIDIPYLRHVQTTKGIGSPQFESDKLWQAALYLEARMFPANTQIKDLNLGVIIDNDYWEHDRLYPKDE